METKQSAGDLGQQARVRRSASAPPLVEITPLVANGNEIASSDTQSLPPSATNRKIRWRWGVLAAVAMTLLSMFPQIDLWITRGADWQGSYANKSGDEEIYAAYINGLISGRPRRTQPLEVANPSKPSYESLFSMQIVPAYLIALPASAFGLSVARAFIVLTPLIAFLSTLVIFYLLTSVTRDEILGAVGSLAILIFGTLAARQSVALKWIGWIDWSACLLFLRLYQPAATFPVFFGFIVLIWQAFTEQGRRAWYAAIMAGAVFAALIFSYFFLWTAALAWLACFVLVWLVARRAEWLMLVKRLAPTMLFAASALAGYTAMLAHRNPILDKKWLVFSGTHAPDFLRGPEWIGAAALLLLLWGVKTGRVQWREPVVLLASSLALMPFAVFNQQVITGRSLEPIHYEIYNANYMSLLAMIFSVVIIWGGRELQLTRRLPRILLTGLTCVVLGWGVIEAYNTVLEHRPRNIECDKFMPVAKRLTQLATERGKGPNERETVFSPDISIVSDNIAPSAPQVPLWCSHTRVAAGLTVEEQQERYFQYLYFSGVRPGTLERALANNNYFTIITLFGYERFPSSVTAESKALTMQEIREKSQQYSEFIASFNRERARRNELSYVVLYSKTPSDLSNLDRWYMRDKGEQIGPFTLYQVKPR